MPTLNAVAGFLGTWSETQKALGIIVSGAVTVGVVAFGSGVYVSAKQARTETDERFEQVSVNTLTIQRNTTSIQEAVLAIAVLAEGDSLLAAGQIALERGQRRMECLLTLTPTDRVRITENPLVLDLLCPPRANVQQRDGR
jgi:hypothetical protein